MNSRSVRQVIPSYALGTMMIFAGLSHFIAPEMYTELVPPFLPMAFSNYGAGVMEVLIGAGFFMARFRLWSAIGFTILMGIFQIIHVADLFRDEPALVATLLMQNPGFDTSLATPILVFRVIVQFVLIFLGVWYYRKEASL